MRERRAVLRRSARLLALLVVLVAVAAIQGRKALAARVAPVLAEPSIRPAALAVQVV
jgi:hypothetical protein